MMRKKIGKREEKKDFPRTVPKRGKKREEKAPRGGESMLRYMRGD